MKVLDQKKSDPKAAETRKLAMTAHMWALSSALKAYATAQDEKAVNQARKVCHEILDKIDGIDHATAKVE